MSYTIQIKRAEEWPEKYILADGEFGYDKKLNILKIGDGHTWWCKLPAIQSGNSGEGNGNSILTIEKTSTNGLVDIYTIYYTNGTTSNFTITNGASGPQGPKGEKGETGAAGEDGVSVTKTEINDKGELVITLSDNTVFNLGVVVGAKGDKGEQGPAGYTPIKGTDYWTPTDRQSMIDEFQAVSYGEQTLDAEQKAQARKNIEDIPTFSTFTEALENITTSITYFRTLGFYSAYDGADCEYRVKTSAPSGRHTFVKYKENFWISPSYLSDTYNRTIYVKHYGIRADVITETSSGEYLGWNKTIAEANSVIFDELIPVLNNGFTLEFEAGHFFFTRSIGCKRAVNFKGATSQVCANYSQASPVNHGTLLHFPYVYKETVKAENEDTGVYAALYLYTGIVQDIGIMGPDYHNFNIRITRKVTPTITATLPIKVGTTVTTVTAEKETFEEAEAIISNSGTIVETYGIYFYPTDGMGNGGNVQNTRVIGFTCGIYSPTTNNVIADCYIHTAKVGISIGHDCKVRGIQLWHVITGIEMRQTLGSATNIRGDSIGKHLIECWEGNCILSNIDGDYCVGSLIHYGDGNNRYIHLGQAIGCRGRIAARFAYRRPQNFNINQIESTLGFNLTDVPSNKYEYCSYVSIDKNTQVFGGYIDIVNSRASIFDETTTHFHPDAAISINTGSTVQNIIIKYNIPNGVGADYFNTQVIKNLSTHRQANNEAAWYQTYFNGKTIEDILFITPQGPIRSKIIDKEDGTMTPRFLDLSTTGISYEPQILTEAQQFQARENFGGNTPTIEFVPSVPVTVDPRKTYVNTNGSLYGAVQQVNYTNALAYAVNPGGGEKTWGNENGVLYDSENKTTGYVVGYTTSGGADGVSECEGWCTTGLIEVPPTDEFTIYFKNVEFLNEDTSAASSIIWYKNKIKVRDSAMPSYPGKINSGFKAYTTDATTGDITSITLPNWSSANEAAGETRYIRFGCKRLTESSIVSVNEPIDDGKFVSQSTGYRLMTEQDDASIADLRTRIEALEAALNL